MIDFKIEGGEDTDMMILALFCSLMSIGFFIYLAIQHVELTIGAHSGPSVCNINQHFNCDTVSLSSYSEIFGTPIALWGAWSQAVILVLILISMWGLAADRDRVLRGATIGSLVVSMISIVMFGISHFVVKSYCLFCMGTYLLSWIQSGLLWRQTQFSKHFAADVPHFFGDKKWIPVMAVLMVPAGAFVSNAVLNQTYDMDKMAPYVQQSLETWKASKSSEFNLEKGLSFARSPSNTHPVMTIVEFADFECPHCRMAYPSIDAFAESHDDVRLVFKFFPLDGNCNADKAPKGDGARCVLAKATYCAQSLAQAGWSMHHYIFDHQEEFYRNPDVMPILKPKILELGLNEQALQSCLDSDATHEAIMGMTEEGVSAGVDGTPAIYINGKKMGLGPIFPSLDRIYKSLKNEGS